MKKNLLRIFSLLLAAVILAACSTPDMHGRMPTEKDETIISEDKKNGVIEEGMLGAPAGFRVSYYERYLGYGYNLLEAAYYNHEDIKATNPIIDTDALADEGYIFVNARTANTINLATFISNSTKEYSK